MKEPRSIIITGASSGIGAELARFYAAPGVFLALGGRNHERLAAIEQECRAKGAQVKSFLIDVTDREKMWKVITAIDARHPLDLVIANAGISGGTGGDNYWGEPIVQVRSIFDINFTGILNTIEPVLPAMAARGRGQIALMSSLASFSGWPGAPAYSASKGAVRLYGEALRGSLMNKGIEVNVICPGFIRTPMTDINEYAMPFMIEPEKAAVLIAAGLQKNRGRIAFPWQMYLLAGFAGILPHWLSFRLFTKLPEKKQL